MTELALLGEQS